MQVKIQYTFSSKIWKHNGQAGWHFVSLPKNISKEIRKNLKWQEEGWGRLKANAQIGQSKWDTSIWFDTKQDTYILPVKAIIRKMEKLELNQVLEVSIWV